MSLEQQDFRQGFLPDALTVAPRLLGGMLRVDTEAGAVAIMLTEVEAYLGPHDSASPDPGSHSFRGITPRSKIMFGEPAHLYVYLSYGVHHCINIVCGPLGEASAVLLRAGKVLEGIELAKARRGNVSNNQLARGPGSLTKALGLNLGNNGAEISDLPGAPIEFQFSQKTLPSVSGPRVGVSGLGGSSDYPWRFWLPEEPSVSQYRPGKPLKGKIKAK
ncbi:DNA-3-methyladenine glycosylase [Psychromicrobium lacuslunae]|uniref:DNA-3-methyladenine glycosylase n=1 Tax=Psychromicrobium lacuslunae TaxID=1618207 RepID=UPI0005D31291|nr:DNA-3-methyladenine glycosylase [Psychromicrobium lacuslunae]